MKVQDYLDALPTGEAVCSRKVLYAMKRKGLIADYSPWGYLESQKVWYVRWTMDDGHKVTDYFYVELCKALNYGDKGTCYNPFSSIDEMHKTMPHVSGFYYKGHYFTTKYFDGCFCPYLIKTNPPESRKRDEVNRNISLYGRVI